VGLKNILTTGDIPAMPHHIHDGDNVGKYARQSKWKFMYGKWYKLFRKCWFWQRRNLVGWCIWWGMRAKKFRIWM